MIKHSRRQVRKDLLYNGRGLLERGIIELDSYRSVVRPVACASLTLVVTTCIELFQLSFCRDSTHNARHLSMAAPIFHFVRLPYVVSNQ